MFHHSRPSVGSQIVQSSVPVSAHWYVLQSWADSGMLQKYSSGRYLNLTDHSANQLPCIGFRSMPLRIWTDAFSSLETLLSIMTSAQRLFGLAPISWTILTAVCCTIGLAYEFSDSSAICDPSFISVSVHSTRSLIPTNLFGWTEQITCKTELRSACFLLHIRCCALFKFWAVRQVPCGTVWVWFFVSMTLLALVCSLLPAHLQGIGNARGTNNTFFAESALIWTWCESYQYVACSMVGVSMYH